MTQVARFHVLSILAVVLTLSVSYLPGLHGPFVFDDNVNIIGNPAIQADTLGAAVFGDAARSDRPLARVSLALNTYFAGGVAHSLPFKLTNLVIHLLNAGLVYWFCWLLLSQFSSRRKAEAPWVQLPAIAAALWALHPIQLTSVLYVVQRMTSLSAFFVLLGLILFILGRQQLNIRTARGIPLAWSGLIGGTLFGFACKENAALLPLYAAVIEFVFFKQDWADNRLRRRLAGLYAVPLVVLAVLASLWVSQHQDVVVGTYALREFTPIQRLLTEPRILWGYLGVIALPDIRMLTLFHDDIRLSTSLWSPWTTAPAIAGIVTLAATAVLSCRRLPWLSFAILWFLAGHSMESGFLGLELAHDHRNYLPSVGIILSAVYGLNIMLRRLRHRYLIGALCLAIVATPAFATFSLATIWADEISLANFFIKHHPRSARAHAMLADIHYLQRNDPLPALQHYGIAAELAPHEAAAYFLRMIRIASLTTTDLSDTTRKPMALRIGGPEPRFTINTDSGMSSLRPERALLEQISSHLATQPIHSRVVTALTELADCIVASPERCRYLLDDAIHWCRLAANSSRTIDSVRKALLMQLVRLYIERGDYDMAFDTTTRARLIDPRHPALILMEANIHILLGDPDTAAQLIESLRSTEYEIDDSTRAEADKLAAMITSDKKPRPPQQAAPRP